MITVEYGRQADSWSGRGIYRIFRLNQLKPRILPESNLTEVLLRPPLRPFALFFTQVAKSIRRDCFRRAQGALSDRKQPRMKFRLVHLRGTDRPCALRNFTPLGLLERLQKSRINFKSDLVYLMTDLQKNNWLVVKLRSLLGRRLCEASDITLFSREPFYSNSYLIYAAELALQHVSDGFVETFFDHSIGDATHKLLGTLAAPNC